MNGESIIHWLGAGDWENFQVIQLPGKIEFRKDGDPVAAFGEEESNLIVFAGEMDMTVNVGHHVLLEFISAAKREQPLVRIRQL